MLFNSYSFLFVFLPVVLVGFFLLSGRRRSLALGWLALASLFFYGCWNPRYLGLIAFSIAFNFITGAAVRRRAATGAGRSALIFGLAVNLGLLGFFKYTDFVIETLNGVAGTTLPLKGIVLPLAISFFTFQQIAYLVEAYRGETDAYGFLEYVLFVVYFPHLIAGPLLRPRELIPQLRDADLRPNLALIMTGLTYFVWGLFKKTVIADGVSAYVAPVFDMAAAGQVPGLVRSWGGAVAYGYQIYFDFSGYSDMAIGLGLMIGVRIPLNFNSPYKATNVAEFWRRWHMTLSRFLRDFLFFPLGGGRRSRARQIAALFVTMFLGGLWHGAHWNFVLWGVLHGVYLSINALWRAWRRGRKTAGVFLGRVAARAATFVAVTIGWLIFRADSLASAGRIFLGMLDRNGLRTPDETTQQGWEFVATLALLSVIVFCFPNTQEWMGYRGPLPTAPSLSQPVGMFERLKWKPSVPWALVAGIAAGAAVLGLSRPSVFIYFQF